MEWKAQLSHLEKSSWEREEKVSDLSPTSGFDWKN